MSSSSASAEAAVAHLKRTKPLGGWSAEHKSGGVRLLRRKIPLTDSYFLDIHHDSGSNCVVGILSKPKNGKAQGQIIVDQDGKPAGTKTQIIVCSSYDPRKNSTDSRSSAATRRATNTPTSASTSAGGGAALPTLTDEQNKKLLQYALYAILAATILRMISQAMLTLSLLLVPCVYLYALSTCPSEESFDAKKELRRILRGHHLPENHPEKPKSWLDKTIKRVSAAVTTELATGLGYEVSMMVSKLRRNKMESDFISFSVTRKDANRF